ncbi:hypothetical protein RhiirC2_852641 [Rhizophagus irregularis]|uniref:Uncharacterized protein n=1 Tax=Rhizophagus irregularis TaxID=588596 RepID=A0A2N1MYR0_9GLOM|nr:hypothetical protein RhiirC2_852641 [Rhizophagus irregularis]
MTSMRLCPLESLIRPDNSDSTNNDINSVNEITGIYYRHPTLGEAIILLMKTNDPFDDFVEHETYVAATIGGSDLKTGFKVTCDTDIDAASVNNYDFNDESD